MKTTTNKPNAFAIAFAKAATKEAHAMKLTNGQAADFIKWINTPEAGQIGLKVMKELFGAE